MFLHLGADTVVALEDVLSINDCKSLRSVVNREFLQRMRSEERVVDISEQKPKSFVVTTYTVYLSAISSLTLKKRADSLLYSEDEG